MSLSTPQNCLPSALPTGREKPVPTGSINTRSARSRKAELVVDELERTARVAREVFDHGAARAEDAHVQPRRGRARPAVVREHDGPRARVLALPHVGSEAEERDRLVLVVLHQQRAGRRLVVDRLAADADLVARRPHLAARGSASLPCPCPCPARPAWARRRRESQWVRRAREGQRARQPGRNFS